MIPPTLLGKLKKLRAIRIKWYRTEPYALARSSQITCSSVLSLLPESIEFYIICECSRHPGKSGIPAFWADVFIKWLLIRKFDIRQARSPKNIFPSTFRRDIGRKFVIPFDCISFGIQILLTRHHFCGTISFFESCWKRTVSFLRIHGQFLYDLYDIPFMPGALPARALWTKFRTSLTFISLSLNITVGSWGFGKPLRQGIEIQFKSSEYVIHKWFSSSSFGTSTLPLFYSTQSFLLLNDLRAWRFFFCCFLWFSALEITKILFGISFRIFWSSNLSWIEASFNRRFNILCSDLNFPFRICCLFGLFFSFIQIYIYIYHLARISLTLSIAVRLCHPSLPAGLLDYIL